MKTKFAAGWLPVFLLVFIPLACRKSVIEPTTTTLGSANGSDTIRKNTSDTANLHPPYPQTFVTGCTYSPDYGDTIIFPQPATTQDYIVKPINNPGIGRYFSWPDGMVIDSATGAINVTKTETGLKYAIGFVKEGTTDTCMQTLIIAGASYMDSVYVLANNETTAKPYFNANPNLATAPNGSKFDITKAAYGKKISVNNGTGIIDLKQTLNGGAFGPLPYDGQTVVTDMYYTLNDASNNAVQHIPVQLMYYYSKSTIGAGLISNIQTKLINILTGNLVSKSTNPRPPIIIITRVN
jgi:hypothetical protein